MNLKNQPQQFIKLLVLFMFLGGGFNLSAQVYSDEEIGFDREALTQIFSNEGVDDKNIHQLLVLEREALLEVYVMRLNMPLDPPYISIGCGNIDFSQGFNDNQQNEWLYKRRTLNNDPENVSESYVIPSVSGSKIIETQNIQPQDVIAPITAEMLNLDQFGSNMIRLGRNNTGRWVETIEKKMIVTEENRLLNYRYAVVLQEPHNHHSANQQPFFTIFIKKDDSVIQCSVFTAKVPETGSTSGLPGFIQLPDPGSNNMVWYKPTSTNSIDLLNQGLEIGDEITLVVEVGDCSLGGHYGYAFFEGFCGGIEDAIIADSNGYGLCTDVWIDFSTQQDYFNSEPVWKIFHNGNTLYTQTAPAIQYYFTNPGDYLIEATIPLPTNGNPGCDIEVVFTRLITIENCPCTCDCNSFAPVPGQRYLISGWVSEDHVDLPMSYEDTHIKLEFIRTPYTNVTRTFYPSGSIIDEWQQITGEFVLPQNTKRISISLVNDSGNKDAFFDDIRIHPFNSNLKSFVYDQQTQQLMAELDENNFATFYEYDKEGGLIRIKKETENGVYTIQETRSGSAHLNNQ